MNVWLLLIEKRINATNEKAVGPFTAVAIEDDRVLDALTGTTIVRRFDPEGTWGQGDGRTGKYDRIVIQPERHDEPGVAPWGTRGV